MSQTMTNQQKKGIVNLWRFSDFLLNRLPLNYYLSSKLCITKTYYYYLNCAKSSTETQQLVVGSDLPIFFLGRVKFFYFLSRLQLITEQPVPIQIIQAQGLRQEDCLHCTNYIMWSNTKSSTCKLWFSQDYILTVLCVSGMHCFPASESDSRVFVEQHINICSSAGQRFSILLTDIETLLLVFKITSIRPNTHFMYITYLTILSGMCTYSIGIISRSSANVLTYCILLLNLELRETTCVN